MSTGPDPASIDSSIHCRRCDAVCCRLTVMVMPDDPVPRHLVDLDDYGTEVMARGEEGWCIALDTQRMCCGIYAQRPQACRDFEMGSAACRDERADYQRRYDHIPLQLLDGG